MSSDFSGGPGFLAFLATFGLVVAGVLLFLSLNRHLRKVRRRDARERAEASGDAEGREGRGDEVTGEPGDR